MRSRLHEWTRPRSANEQKARKEFLLNVVYYLNDDLGIMQLRNRTLKMRLLDKVRIQEEKKRWQWLNLIAPLLFITIFSALYNAIRRFRYARS